MQHPILDLLCRPWFQNWVPITAGAVGNVQLVLVAVCRTWGTPTSHVILNDLDLAPS